MMRLTITLAAVFALAIVAAELIGLAFLWSEGRLTNETVAEFRALFERSSRAAEEIAVPEEVAQAAKDEVVQERALSILELSARERELTLLKRLVEAKTEEVIAARDELDQLQSDFVAKLKEAEDKLADAAVEQARGILLALPPEEAVAKLMTLTPDEAVVLMKGMPEKDHAKILQQFRGQAETERGNEIFKAIVHGQPQRQVFTDIKNEISDQGPKKETGPAAL